MLDVKANKGITVNLEFDNDRKPIDIFDIHGNIETLRTREIKDL